MSVAPKPSSSPAALRNQHFASRVMTSTNVGSVAQIFGPVVAMLKWSTREEAVQMANATAYGLTAAIYTNDLQAAMTTAQEGESGYVWVNGVAQHSVGLPFGGVKNSGLGGEEALDELLSYTRTKTVNILLS